MDQPRSIAGCAAPAPLAAASGRIRGGGDGGGSSGDEASGGDGQKQPPRRGRRRRLGGVSIGLVAVAAAVAVGSSTVQAFLLPPTSPPWHAPSCVAPHRACESSSPLPVVVAGGPRRRIHLAPLAATGGGGAGAEGGGNPVTGSGGVEGAGGGSSSSNVRQLLSDMFDALHAKRDAKDQGAVLEGVQAILGTGLELTPKHCTMLISALGAVGLWRETVRALHEMKGRGWAVNKVTYGAVVSACAYARDMSAARRVMDEMRGAGVMPDAVEYSSMLHGYKRLNRTEECLACFDEMLFYGVKPSTRTYDGVLGALAAAERWGQFGMYLERMQKDHVKLSAITYGWAMRGAERAQDWGAVLSLFRNLQKDLYHPTAPMCHAALKAALALNDLGTAVAAMKTLVREGWNFGRGVYSTLQQRLLFDSKVDALKSLMAEAQTSTSNQREPQGSQGQGQQGSNNRRGGGGRSTGEGAMASFPYHDTSSCNLVLTDLSKRRRLDLAYAFLSLMHELGLKADTVSYNILMDLALKVKRPSKVRELLAEMQSYSIPPGVITYNILLSACAAVEDRTEALALWADFKTSGLLADRILYLSLMNALNHKAGGWAESEGGKGGQGQVERQTVFDLLDEAAEAGIPLDTQLANYALRLLAGAKDVQGVEMLLERMRTGGVGRDVVSWTTAIKAFHEARDWEKALSWLGEMEAEGVRPNEMTYATAMHVLSQAGQHREALRLLSRMEAKGIKNVVALTSAMTACEAGKAYEDGLALWDRMQELGLRPTMATVDVALKLCEKVLGGLAPPSSSSSSGQEIASSSTTPPTSSSSSFSSPTAGKAKREHALQRAVTILEQSLEWGLVGRRATFRRVLRLLESEKGRAEMVKYADGLVKSGRFRRLGEEGRLLMVEALCDVGLFRHALHILRAAAPAAVPERRRLYGMVMAAASSGGDHDLVLQLHDEVMAMAPGPACSRDVFQAVLQSLRALGVTAAAPSSYTAPSTSSPTPLSPTENTGGAPPPHSPDARWHRLVNEMLALCATETKGVAAGNEVLAACVAAREWGLGTRALVEVGRRRLAFDEQTYQHAIAVLAERREGPRAVQLLREMQGRGFSPRTAEYNHAMFACLDRHWETALELFRELEAGGMGTPRMDTGTAMAALGACRAGRQWQLAPQVIEAARQREVEPSLLLYNALLGVYAAAQQTDRILATLEEMRFRGVRPDEFTYNTAIGAFAKVGDYRQANQWLSVMSWEGVAASTVTYNCVLDACANGGNPQRAAELFQEMKDRKVGVDQVTYGSLIHAFAKVGQWEAALRFLDEMRSPNKSGVWPNNFVYCSAMSACNRGNEWAIALDLLTQMMEEDGLAPDQYTINEGLNACARGGLCERALEILDMARAAGVQADVISYNKALQACIGTRRWAEAQGLMRRMAAERVAPDRTTHSLVEEVFLHGPPTVVRRAGEEEEELEEEDWEGLEGEVRVGIEVAAAAAAAALLERQQQQQQSSLSSPSSSSSARRGAVEEDGRDSGPSASAAATAAPTAVTRTR